MTTAQSAAAQSSVTPNTTTQTDNAAAPVMVAPQQMLAQAESQGPQAPLSSISAGIKQMEVTGTDEVRKAVQLEVKPKAGEAEKSLVATTSSSESSQSQTVQHGQNSQPQPQVADSRAPAAEGTLRREPQNLPHLKLASQEAPAELHQKVNVMLAEKLQQAEIQLDPLGLGKMRLRSRLEPTARPTSISWYNMDRPARCWSRRCPVCATCWQGRGSSLARRRCNSSRNNSSNRGSPPLTGRGSRVRVAVSHMPVTGWLRGNSPLPTSVCWWNRQTVPELISMLDAIPSKFMISNKFETRVDKGWLTITS